MVTSKYKLIRVGKMDIHYTNSPKNSARFYQLKALRDIPEHGVKAGDLGGYVTRRNSLSHQGSCWVGGQAQIIGKVTIEDNAYIGDKAVVHRYFSPKSYDLDKLHIRGNAKVTGHAVIEKIRLDSSVQQWETLIEGNVEISGNTVLQNVNHIEEDVKIYGKATLIEVNYVTGSSKIYENAIVGKYCKISGSSEIFGYANIGTYCKVSGASKLLANVRLGNSAEVRDSVIGGYTEILPNQRVIDGKLISNMIGSTLEEFNNGAEAKPETSMQALPDSTSSSPGNRNLQLLNDVEEKIASYETDIVKLIKYPAMVDKSIPETLALTVALSKAKRLSSSPESNEFKEAVESLEEKFFIAESHAAKMVSSIISDEGKKKLQKAKDLFRIASNEASSEQEKKVSFKQGFKQLEGIIAVPEVAVDTFRVKIGLKELEILSAWEGEND